MGNVDAFRRFIREAQFLPVISTQAKTYDNGLNLVTMDGYFPGLQQQIDRMQWVCLALGLRLATTSPQSNDDTDELWIQDTKPTLIKAAFGFTSPGTSLFHKRPNKNLDHLPMKSSKKIIDKLKDGSILQENCGNYVLCCSIFNVYSKSPNTQARYRSRRGRSATKF